MTTLPYATERPRSLFTVYNITPYLEDHPGGLDILIEVAGTDATEAFEDVGHSDEAREQLEPMLIGTLHEEVGCFTMRARSLPG